MGLEHFLERIADGDLVITPGDRADIVAGSLAAHLSGTYPAVAGLVLTGGLIRPRCTGSSTATATSASR